MTDYRELIADAKDGYPTTARVCRLRAALETVIAELDAARKDEAK